MELQLKEATNTDLELIHQLQIKSFSHLLEKYKDYGTNPAAEPLSKVINRFNENQTLYFLINYYGKQVGAVRIILNDQENYIKISPMFVIPDYQNKKIGQEVIKQLEVKFSGFKIWKINTIIQEHSLCKFYEKLGYIDTGNRLKIKDGMDIIYYQKTLK